MIGYGSPLTLFGARPTETQWPLGASLAEIPADAVQQLKQDKILARIGAELPELVERRRRIDYGL